MFFKSVNNAMSIPKRLYNPSLSRVTLNLLKEQEKYAVRLKTAIKKLTFQTYVPLKPGSHT